NFFYDSLVFKNDTTTYFNNDYNSHAFYFANKSQVGDSWSCQSDYLYRSFDSITILCEGVSIEDIFGVIDSVKTFSMYSSGLLAGENQIDTFKIRLSKSYGLIEFIPFQLFHTLNNSENYYSYKLGGFVRDGSHWGITALNWNDYFHYHSGDLRKWKTSPAVWYEDPIYFVDSIVNALYYPDSIIYYYNRTLPDTFVLNLKEVYYKQSLENIFSAPNNWPNFATESPYNHIPDYGDYTSIFFSTIELNHLIAPFDTTISISFYSNNASLSTGSCSVYDATDSGSGYSFNSFLGLTSIGSHDNAEGSGVTLIGSRIGGIEWGDISPLSIDQTIDNNNIIISPNPVIAQIKINLLSNKNYRYKIYNFNNQLILSGELENNEINIMNLLSGIYFLELQNENEILRGKFVKM
ncbi:MAG: T9SS type A sorting domain-containing protein, partial [Fimbriimonadaceae bacterium]|nr:T9SS type A sorting domain-containing protein [Chitinophagales bacterium]